MNRPRRPFGTREDAIDLNYLFYRQQVERSLAEEAPAIEERKAHEALATMYEERIEQLTGRDFHFPSRR